MTVGTLVGMAGPQSTWLLDPVLCRGCQPLVGGARSCCGWLFNQGCPSPGAGQQVSGPSP